MDSENSSFEELVHSHPLSSILTACLRSASQYYDYLSDNDKGITKVKVSKIVNTGFLGDSSTFDLILSEQIASIEYVLFEIDGAVFDVSHIRPVKYDKASRILQISILSQTAQEKISKSKIADIKVVSDLKFLVSAIIHFLRLNFQKIDIPQVASSVVPQARETLNSDQKTALDIVFTTPLNYIWGAPGTGKTKAVLSESVIAYLKAKATIAIFAPTNNALEQILYGLIPELDNHGLGRKKVLRIGSESEMFRELYPEVCEIQYTIDEKNDGKRTSYKRTPAKANVIAMTLDSYILREELHELEFDHIFLDEAGFANIVKTLILCRKSTPLTLLGDHCQLPPVCEISKAEQASVEYSDTYLWGMSGIYIENLLTMEAIECKKVYLQNILPKFETLRKVDLLETHRYGKNLAQILNQMIYKNGLFSNLEDTGVFFVNAGNCAVEALSNKTEADMLKKLIDKLRTKKNSEIGILTPFNAQVKVLKSLLPLEKDNIMTIHKSQGREFDIVIFSPVCLHYHLTNSDNMQARYAINVALSRVRQTLIVVCDTEHWMSNQNQLITKILLNARELRWG